MSYFSNKKFVHVVIGIVQNSKRQVLVSKRKAESHLGDLLEFPGGKVEKTESPIEALHRELKEEINIDALKCAPLIQIPYCYSNRRILLDAYLVKNFNGEIVAKEKQEIFWQSIDIIDENNFPAANYGVLQALKLPGLIFVTPECSIEENFLKKIEDIINKSITNVIQLRAHSLPDQEYLYLARKCKELCSKKSVKLILNRGEYFVREANADGMHLTSKKLLTLKKRPLTTSYLLGASCHNLQEIECANRLKLDYIFIGPVLEKHQIKSCKKLEWNGFAKLSKYSQIPSYAIGGVSYEDIETSIQQGGQGVAAIRSIWSLV